jgi:hypothetical protein
VLWVRIVIIGREQLGELYLITARTTNRHVPNIAARV